jgi:phosphonopyruvate decarboxylase
MIRLGLSHQVRDLYILNINIAGLDVDFCKIALACGYRQAQSVSVESEIPAAVANLRNSQGPSLLEVKIKSGARKDLGRPTTTTE